MGYTTSCKGIWGGWDMGMQAPRILHPPGPNLPTPPLVLPFLPHSSPPQLPVSTPIVLVLGSVSVVLPWALLEGTWSQMGLQQLCDRKSREYNWDNELQYTPLNSSFDITLAEMPSA